MLKSDPLEKIPKRNKCSATFIQNSHFGNLYSPQGVKNHLFYIVRTWLWKCKCTVHSCSKIRGIINIHLRVFVSFWCDEKRLWAILEIPPAFPFMQTSFFCRHIIVHRFHKRWKTWSAKKQTHNKSLLQVNDFQKGAFVYTCIY